MRVRYLIKFTKEDSIKFISHLDLMRTIQKVMRRSELPLEYSKGFNPHIALSIAQPLSVGVYSEGEYMDIVLVEDVACVEVIEKLNAFTARGIKFLHATKIPAPAPNEKKTPQGMALIDAARYSIKVKYDDTTKVVEQIDAMMKQNEWTMVKKSKKGEKEVNIKPYVHEMKYWVKDDELVLNILINSGSREHLAPELLVDAIKERTTGATPDYFVNIKREEMYFEKGNKFVPLYKIV